MIGARFTLLNATNPFIAWPQSAGDNKELRGVCSPFHTEGFASWELHETEAPAQRPSGSTVDLEQQLRLARIVTPLFPSRLAARGSARNSPRFTKLSSHIGRQTRTDQAANGNTLHVPSNREHWWLCFPNLIKSIGLPAHDSGCHDRFRCCKLLKD